MIARCFSSAIALASLMLATRTPVMLSRESARAQSDVVGHTGEPHFPSLPRRGAATAAKGAVVEFTGRDIAQEIACTRYWWNTPVDLRLKMHVPRTAEEFTVRERDNRVVRWDFGDYRPDVGVEVGPTEAFERSFIARYYRGPIGGEMVRMGSQRSAWWKDSLPNGVVAGVHSCRLLWEGEPPRLKAFISLWDQILIDPAPGLTYREAVAKAVAFVTAWPGITDVEHAPELLRTFYDERFWRMPELGSDDAGVQRLVYTIPFRLKWDLPQEAEPEPTFDPSPPPRTMYVIVDAHTGACFIPWSRSILPPQ